MNSNNLKYLDGYVGDDSYEHSIFVKLVYVGLSKEYSNFLAPIMAWLDKNRMSLNDYVPNENYDNDYFLKLKEYGCEPELALKLASIKLQINTENKQL